MLEDIFDMGYCVETFREKDGRILVFVWEDIPYPRDNRKLICSRYAWTFQAAIRDAVEYLITTNETLKKG